MKPVLKKLMGLTVESLSAPSMMTVTEWADKCRWLSREYTNRWGKFRSDFIPYCVDPMNDANNPAVEMVVLKWARQLIKSTIIENVMGYFIDCDPSPILLVLPTVEAAETFSKERLAHTIRDTPALREKMSDAPSRDSSNTIRIKTFPGGSLAIVGANSPTGLGMRSRRVVLCDEIDRYPRSAGSEGDPVNIAIKTTETFDNAVIYLTSTTTTKGASRIAMEFEETDKRYLYVKCPHCGQFQTIEWPNVRWPKGKPELAHCICSSDDCAKPWTEKERIEAVRFGEWRATKPFNGKAGYFLSGLYSVLPPKKGTRSRMHQYAKEFLEARAALKRGSVEKMKVFVNCVLNQEWDEGEQGEKLDPTTISQRVEEYSPDTLSNKALVVIGSGDVQKDRIEIEWQAVGMDEESWGIEVVKLFGDPTKPDVWRRLSDELCRTFKRQDGVTLKPACFAIDTHYKTKETRDWCKSHGTGVNVFAVLGSTNTQQEAMLVSRWNKEHGIRVWHIATPKVKDLIYARLKVGERGPRYMHMPIGYGYTDEWFAQLTCEKAVTRYKDGYPYRVYIKDENAANEAIDLRVYGHAGLEILKPRMSVIADALEDEAKRIKLGDNAKKDPPKPQGQTGGGFIGGGSGFVNSGGFQVVPPGSWM